VLPASGSTSCTSSLWVGKRTADEEFLQLILDEMRPRLVDAQSKGAAAAQRELNLSTAATMSNALPPPRSAG